MIRWKLKSQLLVKHQITSVTDFQKLITKKTGIIISLANLCKYVNRQPKMIRLETIEIICSALECDLSSLLNVKPKQFKSTRTKKLSFKNTPKAKIASKSFPEPSDYEDE